MNRIQRKCLIGSVILHSVLALTLLFGAAFFSHEPAAAPVLQVVPDSDHITDDATHGGDRTAPPPPPVAEPPQPVPPPVVQQLPPPKVEPTVKPEPPKIAAVDPKGTEPKPAPKKAPQISTNIVRNAKPPTTIAANNAANALAKKRAEDRRRAAAIANTISGINNGVSSATKVDIEPGPGDGGALSANYRDLVGSKYQEMWDPPSNPATDNAIVKASVTIASDGRVISARITVPSGDAEVDASVKRTLDQVTYIAPFPKGSKDTQRTYPIKFDLKAKRLT